MGVVHGLQAFVERMLAQDEPGHIVNTSSVLGVWVGGSGVYGVSKHAVTALSEGLYLDLQARRARIGVSVLLPALTATRINTASCNQPLGGGLGPVASDPEIQRLQAQDEAHFMENGMSPETVGEIVLEAIRCNRFYVFTHPGTEEPVRTRARAIVEGGCPARPEPRQSLRGRQNLRGEP